MLMRMIMGMTKDKKSGRPYMRVLLTLELEQQMEKWKAKTGSSHSDIVRSALREYLADKVPKEDLETAPDEDEIEDLLLAISERYRTLLERQHNSQGGDLKKVKETLEADILTQANAFKVVDLPATLSTVVDILLADDLTPTVLKDYAKMVLNPPSRDRPKRDFGLISGLTKDPASRK
jgi:Arc/MetJ-type ribon-helix-helix transcriptional regulator